MNKIVPALIAAHIMLTGCAQRRPVLAPNAYLVQQGEELAKADIADCIEQARAVGIAEPKNRDTEKAAEDAARAGATGAATGAVHGDVGIGAAIGAIGQGIGGLLDAILHPTDDDPEGFRAYVETCLRQKGYDVEGWR